MGRQARKYTAKGLEKAIEAYFDSISYTRPLTERVAAETIGPDGIILAEKDAMGHQIYRQVPVITADGNQATEIVWTEPPDMVALCLRLGISRTTLWEYGRMTEKDDPGGRYRRAVRMAKDRIELYLARRLEDNKAARGAQFALEHNFGWKERREISLDEDTRKAVTETERPMTLKEKQQLLSQLLEGVPKPDGTQGKERAAEEAEEKDETILVSG